MKTCTKCGENKPFTEFWKCRGGAYGLTPSCKNCIRRYAKEWRLKNPDKAEIKKEKNRQYGKNNPDKARNRRLKYTHGIQQETWDVMFAKQNGCCAICARHQSCFCRVLQVDHDHKTGQIRGLLCTKCNTKLAAVEEDGFVDRALVYLNHHKIRIVRS